MRKKLFVLAAIIFCAMLCTPIVVGTAKKVKKKPVVKLIQEEKNWTRKSVKVSVKTKAKSGIKKILWRKGKIKKSKSTSWNGAKNIRKKKYFKAPTNGWYSVKVIDKKGNSKIERVKINNIDKQGPTGRLKYTVNNKVATVNVTTSDSRGVSAVRWSHGYITSKSVSQFPNIVTNNMFTANKNGYYTVWAKDSLGNVSLGYVYVKLWTDLVSLTPFDYYSAGVYEGTIYDRWENAYSNVVGLGAYDNKTYIEYFLNGAFKNISGTIVRGNGIEDDDIVWMEILADDVVVYTSPKMGYKTQAINFDESIQNAKYLQIRTYSEKWGYLGWKGSGSSGVYVTDGKLYN